MHLIHAKTLQLQPPFCNGITRLQKAAIAPIGLVGNLKREEAEVKKLTPQNNEVVKLKASKESAFTIYDGNSANRAVMVY